MPQAVVCNLCRETLVFTGAAIELVGESRVGFRHRCGAMNELQYLCSDESGRALYRVIGLVPGAPLAPLPVFKPADRALSRAASGGSG